MGTKDLPTPLILTSKHAGSLPGDRDRPRPDFEVLAERINAPVSFPGAASAPLARLETALRVDVSQAFRARRRPSSAYVSLSERVGIPLALTRPAAPHVMVAHLLTSAQKRLIVRRTRFLEHTDLTLVFSRAQERFLREEIGMPESRARFIWDKVDHRFFAPAGGMPHQDYILSVGREQRDYETLIAALASVATRCIILPGSTWSHRQLSLADLPGNIERRESVSYRDLRELYRSARLVVVPVLAGTDYAAGVNGILEAMSCGRPVIATRTPGLAGYIRDGENGREVAAGDPRALRQIVDELWNDQAQADRLARAGRATVERGRTIEHFVETVAEVVHSVT